jgi:hypothetical protein
LAHRCSFYIKLPSKNFQIGHPETALDLAPRMAAGAEQRAELKFLLTAD